MSPFTSDPANLVEALDRAFNAKDVATVLSLYEDSASVVVDPSGAVRRGSELKSFFESAILSDTHAKQISARVIECGDIALFLSHWQLTFRGPDAEPFKRVFSATTVLRRQSSGDWKIVIDNPYGLLILESH